MPVTFLTLIRYAAFAAFALAVLVAVAGWLVRTRRVSPFGLVGKTLRQATDPLLRPVERRLVRGGGTPAQAGWWLVIGAAIVGVLLVSLAQWAVTSWSTVTYATQAGGRVLVALVVQIVYQVLFFAILVRVLASWLGGFRYSPWLRPVYWLTDWLVEPIRRLLPSMGPFDFSPLVALLVLWALKQFVLQVLL